MLYRILLDRVDSWAIELKDLRRPELNVGFWQQAMNIWFTDSGGSAYGASQITAYMAYHTQRFEAVEPELLSV